MTIGAAFACAYRRDLARTTRRELVKRTQNQNQAPAASQAQIQTKALSSSAAPSNVPRKDADKLSDADLLGVEVSERKFVV